MIFLVSVDKRTRTRLCFTFRVGNEKQSAPKHIRPPQSAKRDAADTLRLLRTQKAFPLSPFDSNCTSIKITSFLSLAGGFVHFKANRGELRFRRCEMRLSVCSRETL